MTSEESKGGKGEKLVEVDTNLSWDHEGLKPLPKAPKDRLNQSPKPLKAPRFLKQGKILQELLRKSIQPLVGILKKENTQEFPTKKIKIERKSLQRKTRTLV